MVNIFYENRVYESADDNGLPLDIHLKTTEN